MQLCGRIFKKMPPTPFCPHPAPKSLYKGEPLYSVPGPQKVHLLNQLTQILKGTPCSAISWASLVIHIEALTVFTSSRLILSYKFVSCTRTKLTFGTLTLLDLMDIFLEILRMFTITWNISRLSDNYGVALVKQGQIGLERSAS